MDDREVNASRTRGRTLKLGAAALVAALAAFPARGESPPDAPEPQLTREQAAQRFKTDYQWDVDTGEVYLQSQQYLPYVFSSNNSRISPSPAIGKTLLAAYQLNPGVELRFGGFFPIRQEMVAVRGAGGVASGGAPQVADAFEFSKAIAVGVGRRLWILPMTPRAWLEIWGAASTIIPIAPHLKYYVIPTLEASARLSFRDGAGIDASAGYAGILSTGTAFAKLGVSKRF